MKVLSKILTIAFPYLLLFGIGYWILNKIKSNLPIGLQKAVDTFNAGVSAPATVYGATTENMESVDRLIENTFAHPVSDYIKAMYRLESGNLTNSISRDHNNIFSMKQSFKRPKAWDYVTDEIESDGNVPFVGYDTVSNAIYDLLYWFRYHDLRGDFAYSLTQFNDILKDKGYYTLAKSQYLAGLKRNYVPSEPEPDMWDKITSWFT